MPTQTRKKPPETVELVRHLGANVYLLRVKQMPKLSQERLSVIADVALETIRGIEDSRDPSKPAKNPRMSTVERLAVGFRSLGVDITALDLLATPSKPTGQPRHLSVVPHTGEALPIRG